MEQLGVKENLDPSKTLRVKKKAPPPPQPVQEGRKPQRQVIIAASKNNRERPPDTRQREPAKLLTPVRPPRQSPIEDKQVVRLEPKPKPIKTLVNPISYARWVQHSGSGNPQLSKGAQHLFKGTSRCRIGMHHSINVSPSGSLSSQGSSGSEGPKSVLKKPRTVEMHGSKKNVTFNAFAMVQLVKV